MNRVRFGVIGISHAHINSQVRLLQEAGAELTSFYGMEPELCDQFRTRFPDARQASSESEVLEDPYLHLVATAAIPSDRARIAIAAMRHGKDVMADKPGATSLGQLKEIRSTQADTGRIYSVYYGGHFASRATVCASRLVKSGAIGRVIQSIGLGPHAAGLDKRPSWFFQKSQYGGILTDLASHHIEQFLHFTDALDAHIESSFVNNCAHPDYPELEDFGELILSGESARGYIRVDWFTPKGLSTWGDDRLMVVGTEGYIEVRKTCDLAGRSGGDHLFLVDRESVRHIECRDEPLVYGPCLVEDILCRTETAMPQERCFLSMELALQAQENADQRLRPL